MSASATNSTFDFLSSGMRELTIARTIEGMWKIFVVKLRPPGTLVRVSTWNAPELSDTVDQAENMCQGAVNLLQ